MCGCVPKTQIMIGKVWAPAIWFVDSVFLDKATFCEHLSKKQVLKMEPTVPLFCCYREEVARNNVGDTIKSLREVRVSCSNCGEELLDPPDS